MAAARSLMSSTREHLAIYLAMTYRYFGRFAILPASFSAVCWRRAIGLILFIRCRAHSPTAIKKSIAISSDGVIYRRESLYRLGRVEAIWLEIHAGDIVETASMFSRHGADRNRRRSHLSAAPAREPPTPSRAFNGKKTLASLESPENMKSRRPKRSVFEPRLATYARRRIITHRVHRFHTARRYSFNRPLAVSDYRPAP